MPEIDRMGMVLGEIGAGAPTEEIPDDLPHLEREDILQAIRHSAS